MKSWIDITIERIDFGASERTADVRAPVSRKPGRGQSCSLVKAYSSVVTEAKISERAMRTYAAQQCRMCQSSYRRDQCHPSKQNSHGV